MAGGVVRHIVADEIKIVAASPYKSFELSGDHRKNFPELFGGIDARIDNHFANEVDSSSFHQECEWKTRR